MLPINFLADIETLKRHTQLAIIDYYLYIHSRARSGLIKTALNSVFLPILSYVATILFSIVDPELARNQV